MLIILSLIFNYYNQPMSKNIYADAFKQYDTDKSGFIDAQELKSLLQATFKKAGLNLSEESLKYHIEKFDTSKDGKISLEEFCDKMDKYNHPGENKKSNK